VSKFSLMVDWSQLAHRVRTPEPEPTGYSVRWYVTRFNLGGGLKTDEIGAGCHCMFNGIPTLLSRVQPYAVYVPTGYSARRPTALTWILHALETNYNEFGGLDPNLIEELCQNRDSICVMPEGLGPGLNWQGMAETDFWQVWRAVADAYNINPDRTIVAGYSMGGGAANSIPVNHPDLFAGSLVIDGSNPAFAFANVRWVPFVIDSTAADELDPPSDAIEEGDEFRQLGQRFQLFLHSGADHIGWATEDRFGDALAALGSPVRTTDPGVFTYTWTPSPTDAADGVGATGDYWLDNLSARSQSTSATVTADDLSLPGPAITTHTFGPMPVTTPTAGITEGLTWQPGARPAAKPLLTMSLTNVASLGLNAWMAAMRTGTIRITTDGPTTLLIEDLRARTRVAVDTNPAGLVPRTGLASVDLSSGTHTIAIRPPTPTRTPRPRSRRERPAGSARQPLGAG
jgi:hypothetical protein